MFKYSHLLYSRGSHLISFLSCAMYCDIVICSHIYSLYSLLQFLLKSPLLLVTDGCPTLHTILGGCMQRHLLVLPKSEYVTYYNNYCDIIVKHVSGGKVVLCFSHLHCLQRIHRPDQTPNNIRRAFPETTQRKMFHASRGCLYSHAVLRRHTILSTLTFKYLPTPMNYLISTVNNIFE